MKTFQASPQQQAFFDWVQHGHGSCVLEAVAGSGKTTTLVRAVEMMKGNVFFGAYNKDIAEEIKTRVPQRQGLFVATMHAAGFSAVRRAYGNVKVQDTKCRDLFRAMTDDKPLFRGLEESVTKLVSLAKQSAFGVLQPIATDEPWLRLADHFDIDVDEHSGEVLDLSRQLLAASQAADCHTVDFDDMVYAPLYHKLRVFENDWVLIDEAQDTNAARRALALRMLRRGGRLVAVGDRHQAIYGFTGADSDALDLIAKAVNATPMPLTVTYRCPQAVVTHAQKYVHHITAHESAPVGEVVTIDPVSFDNTVAVGDAVLCRFNMPLLSLVYRLIAKGIPARIEGREIGVGLKQLAKRWKVKSFNALTTRLDTFLERETAKYRAKEQESRARAVEDKVECLRVLITRVQDKVPKGSDPIEVLCAEVDTLFGDSSKGNTVPCVVLSSIHKAKGREWNRVYWLQTGPSKWARKEWELQQETNLCYVATTRAKSALYLVEGAA